MGLGELVECNGKIWIPLGRPVSEGTFLIIIDTQVRKREKQSGIGTHVSPDCKR